ncbi:MAG: cadherin-like domain-containing protein, partial [Blastochloris sp.]|nr:cadherin-like domain-containing protein [Blastochloris sp.]
SYSTLEDTPLTVSAAGVLGNDSDIDGAPLSSVLVSGAANGTLSLAADGSFLYTPDANFNGTDSFTYQASDGSSQSETATVTITIGEAGPPRVYLPIMIRAVAVTPPPTPIVPTPTTPPVVPIPTPTTPPVVIQPDLVAAIAFNPEKRGFAAGEGVVINVQITNQGNAPTTSRFWVDLFINPLVPPSAAGEGSLWQNTCTLDPCFGITWAVNQTLQPGESVVLSSVPGSYASDYSRWPGWFASGTNAVYLYVDSWNPGVPYRAVFESNGGQQHLPR